MNEEYHWRETYFVLFDSRQRPTIEQVQQAVASLDGRFELERAIGDDEGLFESITINSPVDNVALEICYEEGEAVVEQGTELAKQLKSEADGPQLAALVKADARLDVMHFERVADGAFDNDDDEPELDPSCLLMTVECLTQLTGGVAIDPASGSIMP